GRRREAVGGCRPGRHLRHRAEAERLPAAGQVDRHHDRRPAVAVRRRAVRARRPRQRHQHHAVGPGLAVGGLRRARPHGPALAVAVPSTQYKYPPGAWVRQTSSTWPPSGTADATLQMGADGSLLAAGAASGPLPLSPLSEDEARDPIAASVMSNTPMGTSPVPSSVPPTSLPGFVARFAAAPVTAATELDGAPTARLDWTP